jgi:glycosyltransferase involved in cell wall biosynthesis
MFLITMFNLLPECSLTIIGKNTKQLKKYAHKNITILDYVENIAEYWKQATFYVHLPKYEAGPITLLEAMIVGLIPITNTNAGHADSVKRISKDLVLNPADTKATARQIRDLIKIPIGKRRKLSETFKKNAAFLYAEKEMTAKFQKRWNRLIT